MSDRKRANEEAARPISSGHQACGTHGGSGVCRETWTIESFSIRMDLSVLGEMEEEAHRGYQGPM